MSPAAYGGWARIVLALAYGLTSSLPSLADEPVRYRHAAEIRIERAAPFVVLDLPLEVLAASQRPDRGDLQLEDARGQPVPFAWLPPRAQPAAPQERMAHAALYPWPRTAQPDALPDSVRVVTRGAQIEVQSAARPRLARDAQAVQGWLIDLGERPQGEVPPQSIQLDWPANTPAFTAAYRLSTSGDLRSWRESGGGHVLALAASVNAAGGGAGPINPSRPVASTASTPSAGPAEGAAARLSQARVVLPADAGRFLRLTWVDAAAAPPLTSARAVWPVVAPPAEEPPLRLKLPPLAAATLTAASAPQATGRDAAALDAAEAARRARALQVDLGAVLELRRVQVDFAAGSRVVPVAVQWRAAVDEPWRDANLTVLYRLERGAGASDAPPPLELAVTARELRFLPPERGASLAGVAATVGIEAVQPRLVFVVQGEPPLRLRVGAARADSGALAAGTLVPRLDDERARFGHAVAGPLQVDAATQAALARDQQWTRWRPWLLWAVLLGGVAGLGAMVWQLARRA